MEPDFANGSPAFCFISSIIKRIIGGQVTTLMSQFGQDAGVTDLLALLPNEEPASTSC
jgi:hypothetical protein